MRGACNVAHGADPCADIRFAGRVGRTVSFETQDKDGAVTFEVRVSPNASRTKVLGVHGAALKLSLAAPPVEGAANAELRRFLARALGVPQKAVTILRGQQGRTKTLRVEGVTAEQVRDLLR